jgi:hypothetical protein
MIEASAEPLMSPAPVKDKEGLPPWAIAAGAASALAAAAGSGLFIRNQIIKRKALGRGGKPDAGKRSKT